MASEDNEGREEVLEEAEEAGQEEKKGGDRWWIYVVVMVLGLAGVGYLALNGIGRSAHKLAAGDKYGRLAAASEEYGGEDAARRGDAFYDAEESDAGGGVISGALMVRNPKLEEAQRQAAGAGSHTAVVSGGGAAAEDVSGGQSPAQYTASASGGPSPGPADGQMAAKLKAKASMGAGAASARTSGQASAFQGGSGSKVGLAAAQNENAPSESKKAGKGSVLSALKGAFQASFYGSRLASQDAAKVWIAKGFDGTPDYETAIEYEEKMRTSLDKVNPGSIPSFLREQELSGGDAKSIDVPKVEGFAVDVEASKAATKESKKNKSMAENMASGLMNGLFSGIGSATSGDEENEDDRSVVDISSEDENAWLFEFDGFDYTDMYGSYGAECGCSEAAPCCCLGSDYYSGSGSTDLSGGYSTDFYDTNGVVWV